MKSLKKETILKKKIIELTKRLEECKEIKNKSEYGLKMFHFLCDTIHIGVGIADLQGKVVYYNKHMSNITGYDMNELKNLDIKKTYVNLKDRKKLLNSLKKKGYVHDFEAKLKRKNGQLYIALLNVIKVKLRNKELLITTASDITKQKRIEKKLLFKNTLLNAQLESSNAGILVVDERGKSILFNQKFGEMWRIPRKLLKLGNDDAMLKFVVKDLKDPKGFLSKVKYLYTHKKKKSKDKISFKDGRIFDRYTSPLLNQKGESLGRLWFFYDITKEKKIEESLKESEEKYRVIAENASDGILLIKDEGQFIYANKALVNLTKYSITELLEMGVKDIAHPKEVQRLIKNVKRRIKGEAFEKVYETIIITKDGKDIPIEITGARTMWKGELVDVVILRDISVRKHAELLERKKTEDLERFNKLAVGRELKMVELKKRIKELEAKVKK